jgi:hypothetical protein
LVTDGGTPVNPDGANGATVSSTVVVVVTVDVGVVVTQAVEVGVVVVVEVVDGVVVTDVEH